MERRSQGLMLLLAALAGAQYEKYSFRGFLASLEQYKGEGWKQSIPTLDASLRLHHLLRNSEAHCHQECAASSGKAPREPWLEEPGPGAAPDEGLAELELFGQVLHDFQRHTPYLYLHYELYKWLCIATLAFLGGSTLHCYRCKFTFFDLPCYTTNVTCQAGEVCATITGSAVGHKVIKKKDCVAQEKCSTNSTDSFASIKYTTSYKCCEGSACNAATTLSSAHLSLSMGLALLGIWFAQLL
uniref:endoplasmic reticulum protein SC65-like n=1 Tax=Euleptes europaea TaxID=460621 RepID=UPI0025423FA7|nr:endoplasmic reticulum protein SC65-like [Euleptes europaea]